MWYVLQRRVDVARRLRRPQTWIPIATERDLQVNSFFHKWLAKPRAKGKRKGKKNLIINLNLALQITPRTLR